MNPQYDKREVVNFSVLVGLGVLLFFIFVTAYFFYGLQSADGETFVKSFVIEKGEGFKDIGARLSQESLIKSIAVFKMYALITGKAQNMQPGTYELSNAMSVPQIVNVVTLAKRNDVLVTIPEGSALRDIEAMLVQNGVLEKKGEIVNFPLDALRIDYPFLARAESLEGFLFPETYYFEKHSSPESAIRTMLNIFARRAWPLLSESKDWYETLILASYLEREVPEFEDRQRVSGVLLKRIRIGMPLQVDATISYAKCNGEMRGCSNIKVLRADVNYSSPFNTYRRTGFTPTPIANPGEAALRAALTPIPSPYLYYLSSPETQETFFSRTLQEHNEKRKKYLSI